MNNDLLIQMIDGKGLKRQYIADLLGITRETLYNKLSGKSDFTAGEIRELAKILVLEQNDIQRIFFS